jgi:hypothetical protein
MGPSGWTAPIIIRDFDLTHFFVLVTKSVVVAVVVEKI